MDGIVDPLSAVNPLLGVIALIAIAIVGYLVHENRLTRKRLRDVQDREIEGLKGFLGVLENVEQFVEAANRDAEREKEFRAHCKSAIDALTISHRDIVQLLRTRLVARATTTTPGELGE